MPPASKTTARLLSIAHHNGITIPKEVVNVLERAASDAEAIQWLNANVDSASLLSDEDLDLWKHVSQSGTKLAEADARQVLDEPGLERAIAGLEAATKQITAQTRALSTQRSLLGHRNQENHGQQRHGPAHRVQHVASEAQQARLINEAKTSDLNEEIRTKISALEKERQAKPTAAQERLKADDRTFEAQEQSALEPTSKIDVSALHERSHQLAQALQMKRVAALKYSLDRTYLSTLEGEQSGESLHPEPGPAILDLKQDIESLYAEIDDVVAMMIGSEHMNEIRSALGRVNTEQQQNAQKTLQTAKAKINQMANGLNNLASEIEIAQAQRSALLVMSDHVATLDASDHRLPASTAATPAPAPQAVVEMIEHVAEPAPDIQFSASRERSAALHLVNVKEVVEKAARHRFEALQLLKAVEGVTDTSQLDELDRRIARASKQLDRIVGKR